METGKAHTSESTLYRGRSEAEPRPRAVEGASVGRAREVLVPDKMKRPQACTFTREGGESPVEEKPGFQSWLRLVAHARGF